MTSQGIDKKPTALWAALLCFGFGYAVWFSAVFKKDLYLIFFFLGFFLAVWAYRFQVTGETLSRCKSSLLESGDFGVYVFRFILILSIGSFCLWTFIFFNKQDSFNLHLYDAGIYGNIVFNSSQGRWFYSSIHDMNALGEHFSPIMALFVPLYWIKPSLLWLMTAMAACFAVCPALLFFINREILKNRGLADGVSLFSAILWQSYPAIVNAVSYEFHPSTLAPPFILLAFLFLLRNRMRWFWATMVFLLLFKENLSLVWIGFGLYSSFVLKRKKLGWTLVVFGGLIGFALIKLVIPGFLGKNWGHLDRFGPLEFWTLKLKYLFQLYWPLCFLPLIDWRAFLLSVPATLLNLSVRYQPQFSGAQQYNDIIAPLLFIAAVYGIEKLRRQKMLERFPQRNRYILGWLMLTVFLVSMDRHSPVYHLKQNLPNEAQIALVNELKEFNRLWPEKTVYFQYNLGAQMENRRHLIIIRRKNLPDWKFPRGAFIALAPSMPSRWIYDYPGALKYLASNEGILFKRIKEPFRKLLIYEVIRDNNPK